MGLWATWAGCKMLIARGVPPSKVPSNSSLSWDSVTDFDRLDFYWEKNKLDQNRFVHKDEGGRLWAKLTGRFKDRHEDHLPQRT